MNRTAFLLAVALAVFCLLSIGSFTFSTSATSVKGHRQPRSEEHRDASSQVDPRAKSNTGANTNGDESDASLPPLLRGLNIDERTYLRLQEEHINLLRGFTAGAAVDPQLRRSAIRQLEQSERTAKSAKAGSASGLRPEVAQTWVELGPRPLSNGHTDTAHPPNVSRRATAVVVDPTNSNKVYLGTAQGGVWRSLDGGATWTAIFESAQSLAIGALALAPSNPSILYVGTGEAGARLVGTADAYFGVGLYRIDNVDSSATLVGPINPPFTFIDNQTNNPVTTTCFGGRGIRQVLVHPTNPA